jgi:hypothetical protein
MAPSASRPPKRNAIGERFNSSATENTTSSTPMLNLKIPGSACAISIVPSGTPARPPIRNGHTSVKSKLRHIDGKVDVCPTTEQIRTSGTASDGGST